MAGIHEERNRAESFGAEAERYDRTRPGYPAELIDWLSADGTGVAIDVGCGTGQLTRLLRGAGWAVSGVEADARMAETARSHGLEVDVSTFEDWEGPTAGVQLICSAQAWHWIDPTIGYAKAARHLAPGGTLAMMWNSYHHSDAAQEVLDRVYGRLAPQLLSNSVHLGKLDLDHDAADAEVARYLGNDFDDLTITSFDHARAQSVDDWSAECLTHSPVALLPDNTRTQLLAEQANELREAVGSTMQVSYTTRVTSARRR